MLPGVSKTVTIAGIAIGGAQKLGKGSALGPNGSRAGHGNGQKPP